VLILILAAGTFCALLGRKDIVTSHEARVAQTARIMAVSGWAWNSNPVSVPVMHMVEIDRIKQLRPDEQRGTMRVNPWLVPVINDQLRLQKPPLPYWCSALVFRFAGVGEWQARLIPALLGFIGTFLVWDLARTLLGNRAGIVAAGVWLSTHFIVDEYRKAMADPYLAFFTLVCVWSWLRASTFSPRGHAESQRALDPARPRGPNGGWIGCFYVSLALGALSKGPVIFITVLIALLALHLCQRRRIGPWWADLIGLIIFLIITLPWPLYIIRHVPNAMDIWRYESVGELTGENVEKVRPWWSYIGYSFQLPLPWTVLWIGGMVMTLIHGRRGIKSPRGRRRSVALLWQVLTIFFFSLSGVKKSTYLLPALPAQTLLIAEAIVILLAFAKRTRFRAMPAVVALAQAMIGIGFAIGMTVFLFRWGVNWPVSIAAGAVSMIVAAIAFIPILKRQPRRWFTVQMLAYAVIIIVLLGLQQPDQENRRSSRNFAAATAQYLRESNLPLMVHNLPEDLAFYLPLDLPDADGLPHALLAVDHSPKDPPETLESLSRTVGDATVIDARPVELPGVDSAGRWRLFEVTLVREEVRI
jgi:4-amino-4-deoxy-L-arabinose transferase-like glycosyltransferase